MIETIIKNKDSTIIRKAWYAASRTNETSNFAIFLDGEFYIHRMNAYENIRALQNSKKIKPLTCLFLSNFDNKARHYDYTCNPKYAEFIANDVIGWLYKQNVNLNPNGNFIGGLSLSGLQSFYTSYLYNKLFSRVLSQSPSMWWNNEWLKNNIIPDKVKTHKIWISVGDKEIDEKVTHPPTNLYQEISQKYSVENVVNWLNEHKVITNYHLFEGGHEVSLWKSELNDALLWLLNKN